MADGTDVSGRAIPEKRQFSTGREKRFRHPTHYSDVAPPPPRSPAGLLPTAGMLRLGSHKEERPRLDSAPPSAIRPAFIALPTRCGGPKPSAARPSQAEARRYLSAPGSSAKGGCLDGQSLRKITRRWHTLGNEHPAVPPQVLLVGLGKRREVPPSPRSTTYPGAANRSAHRRATA